jgi:hypothetical protein
VVYEYRVFIELPDSEADAVHLASEKLYPGAIFRVSKPGEEVHGTPVVVHRVDSHPTPDGPGIAHARTE